MPAWEKEFIDPNLPPPTHLHIYPGVRNAECSSQCPGAYPSTTANVMDSMDPLNPKFYRNKGKKGVFLVKHSFTALC